MTWQKSKSKDAVQKQTKQKKTFYRTSNITLII